MSNLEIKNLFQQSRFSNNEIKILLAVIYVPIGIVLFALRSVLVLFLVFFGQVFPESPLMQKFLNNLACICFGITVNVENLKRKENVDVYISNSLSAIDHLAVYKAIGHILPINRTPLQCLPSLGITDFGNISNTETLKKNIENLRKKKSPIYFCPEETPTNGKALLTFNTKYFKFFEKIQPLCISIKRPFLDISVSTYGSTSIHDLMYFMYSPFTNYIIKFLPSMEKKSLSEEEFANIVRQNIASELKIEATNFSFSDVAEWRKRRIIEERIQAQQRSNTQLGSYRMANPELARMAAQVKEVLPHVPVSAIYNDLAITRSVDTTITNILEGRVRFIPETPRTTPPSTSTSHSSSSSSLSPGGASTVPPPSLLNTGASSFGKTASERTKSFQERKEQLIAAARRRYIEKHNLDIPL